MLVLDDTIVAIASAPGGAARGIVRLSGPDTVEVVRKCFVPAAAALELRALRAATVVTGIFVDGKPDASDAARLRLPCELYLWPSGRSYTRQPMAEIHTFGSPPLMNIVVQTLCEQGARTANPGEFTLRAFLGGRIDLVEAEAVLGVIDATDRRQLEIALDHLAGGLSRPLTELRGSLLDLLADLEAGLDFVEDDIRFVEQDELQARLAAAAERLDTLSKQLAARSWNIGRPRVALVGAPNAGKSSLFNALASNATALVSAEAGTTRDYLTAIVNAEGLEIELIDTAGIEHLNRVADRSITTDGSTIDSAARLKAIDQHRQADLLLVCADATVGVASKRFIESIVLPATDSIIVLTKCDLNHAAPVSNKIAAIETSSHAGLGLDRLRRAIRNALIESTAAESWNVAATSVRIRESLSAAIGSIATARSLVASTAGDELVAAEIRVGLNELGKIIGAVYTDDLLDRIFSRFCIGK
jgi:tRNA modification GTPase